MPKEFFSVAKSTSLNILERGSKIHVIGICGVAMAQISVALANMGYTVTGSDKEYYEPMASLLKENPIELFNGFTKENIADDVQGRTLRGNRRVRQGHRGLRGCLVAGETGAGRGDQGLRPRTDRE